MATLEGIVWAVTAYGGDEGKALLEQQGKAEVCSWLRLFVVTGLTGIHQLHKPT